MGQLISGASGGGWQPPARSRALLAGLSETGQELVISGDKVTAALADGVLPVTAPRAEAGQPRRIQVTAA